MDVKLSVDQQMSRGGGIDSITSCYNNLAYAVIMNAVHDYFAARFYLETLEDRYFEVDEGVTYKETIEKKAISRKRIITDCEKFFESPWFVTLSNGVVDQKAALAGLENTYKTKYYPAKYEELYVREMRKHIKAFTNILKSFY